MSATKKPVSQTTTSRPRSGFDRVLFCFGMMFVANLVPVLADADGVVVRARETQGPFTITLFTPNEVSRRFPADLTVMVQSRDSGEVVMDAEVELGLVPPTGAIFNPNDLVCGPGNGVPVSLRGQSRALAATHAQAANKLLYGASVMFPSAGNWQLLATVRRGSEVANASYTFPVNAPPSRLVAVWGCLALPPLAIGLFACNQWLRSRQGRNSSKAFGNDLNLASKLET